MGGTGLWAPNGKLASIADGPLHFSFWHILEPCTWARIIYLFVLHTGNRLASWAGTDLWSEVGFFSCRFWKELNVWWQSVTANCYNKWTFSCDFSFHELRGTYLTGLCRLVAGYELKYKFIYFNIMIAGKHSVADCQLESGAFCSFMKNHLPFFMKQIKCWARLSFNSSC